MDENDIAHTARHLLAFWGEEEALAYAENRARMLDARGLPGGARIMRCVADKMKELRETPTPQP